MVRWKVNTVVCRPTIAIVPLLASLVGVLHGQSANASLTGRVTDPSGAIIANATITAIGADTNVRYLDATNDSGNYYLPNLPPGNYRLEVEKTGFKNLIKPEVIFHVQDAFYINFQHDSRPCVCRNPTLKWQKFPDVDSPHAWCDPYCRSL
jgi:Carboxypeptidase regulatory-like domain